MPRRARIAPAEIIYHALNLANGRSQLFDKPEDFAALERSWLQRCDGEMTEFLRWLTLTHNQRLHAHRHTAGYGHGYQGRFKSFPIEQDQAALNVIRYVERNALRANLVDKAQDWLWCTL